MDVHKYTQDWTYWGSKLCIKLEWDIERHLKVVLTFFCIQTFNNLQFTGCFFFNSKLQKNTLYISTQYYYNIQCWIVWTQALDLSWYQDQWIQYLRSLQLQLWWTLSIQCIVYIFLDPSHCRSSTLLTADWSTLTLKEFIIELNGSLWQ